MTPRTPQEGTDCARMLEALIDAFPEPAWSLNSALNLTAHSRASDLRDMGWNVKWVSRPDPRGGRKRQSGYYLESLPFEDANGQLRIA